MTARAVMVVRLVMVARAHIVARLVIARVVVWIVAVFTL
jgi:hypothetical protein